jgi:hypothetical protein
MRRSPTQPFPAYVGQRSAAQFNSKFQLFPNIGMIDEALLRDRFRRDGGHPGPICHCRIMPLKFPQHYFYPHG